MVSGAQCGACRAGRGQEGGAARPGRMAELCGGWCRGPRHAAPARDTCVLDGVLCAPPTHSRIALRHKSLVPEILISLNMAWGEIEGYIPVYRILAAGHRSGTVRLAFV